MGASDKKCTFFQDLLPGKKKTETSIPIPPPPYTGHSTDKTFSATPYAFADIHSTPHYAGVTRVPPVYTSSPTPGHFNVWGLSGYTGSIDTSTSATPHEAAFHLAKMQQAMNGYNTFDPSKYPFSQSPVPTKSEDDKPSANDKVDTNFDAAKKPSITFSGPRYIPPVPGAKKEDKTSKCMGCDGEEDLPVKKIKDSRLVLCWACVYKQYAYAAEKVWREAEDI